MGAVLWEPQESEILVELISNQSFNDFLMTEGFEEKYQSEIIKKNIKPEYVFILAFLHLGGKKWEERYIK